MKVLNVVLRDLYFFCVCVDPLKGLRWETMADTLFWHQNVGNGWGQLKIWEAGKPVEKDGDCLGV